MTDQPDWGALLKDLRVRAGLSVREMAEQLDLPASTYASYENRPRNRPIGIGMAKMLTGVLEGRGTPPITTSEVAALAGLDGWFEGVRAQFRKNIDAVSAQGTLPGTVRPDPRDMPVASLADRESMARDVPVFGTAAGASSDKGAFMMNMGDPVDWVRRPPGLISRRGVYALYIENESMSPRFEPGDLVYVDPHRPPQIGSDVVIERKVDDHATEAFVKRLVKRTADTVHLRQFNPDGPVELPRSEIVRMDRILTIAELLGM